VYEVSLDENSPALIMVNQVGVDENNFENYGFAARLTENGFTNPMLNVIKLVDSYIASL